jgi:hypothetical protein
MASAILEAELLSNKSLQRGIKRLRVESGTVDQNIIETEVTTPEDEDVPTPEEKFPLHSIQDMINLNNLMATDENVCKTVENFLESHQDCAKQNFTKALNLFIDDEALYGISWTGQKDSFSFRSLNNVVDALWREYL